MEWIIGYFVGRRVWIMCECSWAEVRRSLCPLPPTGIWRRRDEEDSGSPLCEEGWRMKWTCLIVLLFVPLLWPG